MIFPLLLTILVIVSLVFGLYSITCKLNEEVLFISSNMQYPYNLYFPNFIRVSTAVSKLASSVINMTFED